MEEIPDANVSTVYRESQINEIIAPKIQANRTRKEGIERADDLYRDIANLISMTRAENWKSFAKKQLAHIVTNFIEALLTTALVPWTVWQWFSSNDHLVTLLRIIFVVSLELIMWLILAGVSIITAATFVLEDFYRIADNVDESNENRPYSRQISRQCSATNNTQLTRLETSVKKDLTLLSESKPRKIK